MNIKNPLLPVFSNSSRSKRTHSNNNKTNQIIFICFSCLVACFDFTAYYHLADVISETFFPANDGSMNSQLRTLSLLSVGFLSRPIGALLIGHYGDIRGRKPALFLSIGLLLLSTALITCLPSYSQIGVAAPILFIIARLFQGIAFGAHAPLSWVFMAEHANKDNLATYCGLAMTSLTTGSIFGFIVVKWLVDIFSHTQMVEFGWRIPSIIGVILTLFALLLWRKINETPDFILYHGSNKNAYVDPLFLPHRLYALGLTVVLAVIQSSLVIVYVLLLPDLITLKFSFDDSFLNAIHAVGLIFHLLGCIFFGRLADKIGIAKTMMFASILLILQAFAFYYYLLNSDANYLLPLYALLGFFAGMVVLCPAIYVQLFPTATRLTAVSIASSCVIAVMGAVLPISLFYVTNLVSFSPALYIIFVGMLAFIIGYYIYQIDAFHDFETQISNSN